jgi:hypothetical protein
MRSSALPKDFDAQQPVKLPGLSHINLGQPAEQKATTDDPCCLVIYSDAQLPVKPSGWKGHGFPGGARDSTSLCGCLANPMRSIETKSDGFKMFVTPTPPPPGPRLI